MAIARESKGRSHALNFPEFGQRMEQLFDQQIWCWGQDILSRQGNLLVRYGVVQVHPPAPIKKKGCPSIYEAPLPDEGGIVLRGFGVFIGMRNRGGLILRRYSAEPGLTQGCSLAKPPWFPGDLPRTRAPKSVPNRRRALHLLQTLFEWIHQYETWVAREVGIQERVKNLKARDAKPAVEATFMASSWKDLAGEAENLQRHLV